MYSENAKKLIEIVNEKVDKLVSHTSVIYGILYAMDEKDVDYSRLLDIDAAVNVFKLFPNIVRYMEKRRQDIYFSDREVTALAYVLMHNIEEYQDIAEERKELDRAIGVLYEHGLI